VRWSVLTRRTVRAAVVAALVTTGLTGLVIAPPANAAVTSHPGIYHPLTPARVLDTTAAAAGTVSFTALGQQGVPASGVGAVVINVTVATPARGGFVTVFPFAAARPTTSNLNFVAGRTVANLVVVQLGTGGKVSLYNASTGSTRVVADVSGYYESGTPVDPGAFHPLAPARVLDTRTGLGAPASSAASLGTASFQVAGVGGVPAPGASAVVLNVTVATPQASGFATVFPSGVSRPGTSTLNFPAGRTVPNLVTVKLGADGKVNAYNGSLGSVRFVADVFGYYLDGTPVRPGTFQPLSPARIMDTRSAAYVGAPNRVVPARGIVQLPVGGKGGLPPFPGGAVVLNVTVTGAKGGGFVTVYPGGSTRPPTSNLNFTAGTTVANLVVAKPNSAGTVSFYNSSSGTIQLIADVSGYTHAPTAIHFRTHQVLGHATYPASLACATSTFCLAAVGQGRVSRWNGTTWDAPQELFGTSDGTDFLDCPTAIFCMAVSHLGQARTFNGSSWSAAVSTGVASLFSTTGLACASSTLCVTVDVQGKAHRFNGSGWTTATVTTHNLLAVACGSTTFCMAVSIAQTGFRFNGSTWAQVSGVAVGQDSVAGMTCFADSTCLQVDDGGEGRRFNGSTWSVPFGVTLTTPNTFACATETYCLVTDWLSAAKYNGASWSDVSGPPTTLVALRCVSPTFCAGVTADGYVVTFDGATWSAEVGVDPSFGAAVDVSCASSFCAVVSTKGAAVTGNGTVWSAAQGVTPRHALVAVSCVSSSFCLAIGPDSAARYDGSSWSAPTTVDPTGQLTDVACATATTCVAVSADGNAFRFDGSTWSAGVSIASSASSVSCAASTSCTAVVDRRWVADYNGTSWSAPVQVDVIETITDISCPDPSFCLSVDTAGQVLTRTGSTWATTAQLTPAGGELSSVSCASSARCVATVDQESDVYTFDGEVWNSSDSAAPLLTRVSCGSASFCVAIGDQANAYLGGPS
jgi:hypothetical protein